MNDYDGADTPVKISRITRKILSEELDSIYGLDRDKDSWGNCYFHRVKSDLLHDKGLCMACDWKSYINGVSSEDIRHLNFIEAWDWSEIWHRKNNSNSY